MHDHEEQLVRTISPARQPTELRGVQRYSIYYALHSAYESPRPIEPCPAASAKTATVLPTSKVAFDNGRVLLESCTDPQPHVIAVHANMFDHARELAHAPGPRPRVAIHNFANNYSPGPLRTDTSGKHYFITDTQEERLLRATLVDGRIVLPLDTYPISEKGGGGGCICGLYTRDARFANDPRTARPVAP